MMNLQKLRGMGFTETIVQPYGNCIIVPGDKFDPDWEADLGDQGHKCFEAFIGKEPVTLVQIETKPTNTQEKVVYSPRAMAVSDLESAHRAGKLGKPILLWTKDENQRLISEWPRAQGDVDEKVQALTRQFPGRTAIAIKIHHNKLLRDLKASEEEKPHGPDTADKQSVARDARHKKYGDDWRPEENQLIIELYKKHLPYWKIAQQFQDKYQRTDSAVFYRIGALQKEGKIKPRFAHRRLQKKEQAKKTEKIPKSIPPEIPTSIPMKIPTDAPITKDPAVKLLEEIRDLLKPPTYTFDYHCRTCGEHGVVDDFEKVWEFCPSCGKPLIIWNVEA